jgi:predicted RNase H-like nuclease
VAGADGCKLGWFRASRETETGELSFDAVVDVDELVVLAPVPSVVALDIPIGMTDEGPRECDREARRRLGWPRRNSVFPAPVRPALWAATREEANRLTAQRDGRRVGAQAWGLYKKIRSVDAWIASGKAPRGGIREVHPEVCFWAWNGCPPMAAGKKSPEGELERLALAERWLGEGVLEKARGQLPKADVANDDILDAIAALWSATRIEAGTAVTLPENPPADSAGLRMEIVY